MKRTLLLTALLAMGRPDLAQGQILEVEIGGGYVAGSGSEEPGPSLPVFDAGVVFWPSARWGVAVRRVDGPGEDLHEPVTFLDRTFLGTGHLRYWTFTARHRLPVTPALGVEIGFGLMTHAHFDDFWVFNDARSIAARASAAPSGASRSKASPRGRCRDILESRQGLLSTSLSKRTVCSLWCWDLSFLTAGQAFANAQAWEAGHFV